MIVGVDLSTRAIDLVAIDEDEPARADHLRIPLEQPWWEAARWMRMSFVDHDLYRWLEDRSVHLAGIERPYGPNRQAIASLHTILGAFLAALPYTVAAFEITPADMRRELGLPGNCAKAGMHRAIREAIWRPDGKWSHTGSAPWLDWPPDAYDAWAAAYACLRINERGTPPTEEAA
jgi:hypothetical protein